MLDKQSARVRQYARAADLPTEVDWSRYCVYHMTLCLRLTSLVGRRRIGSATGIILMRHYEPQHWRRQRLHEWAGTVYTTGGICSTGYTMYHKKSRGKLLYCTVQYMNGSGHNRSRRPFHPYDASTPVMCCRMLHLCWQEPTAWHGQTLASLLTSDILWQVLVPSTT
jgi:hypothetical protein